MFSFSCDYNSCTFVPNAARRRRHRCIGPVAFHSLLASRAVATNWEYFTRYVCASSVVGLQSGSKVHHEQDGVVVFGGDESGAVHRWEISGSALEAAGLTVVEKQLRDTAFLERRLPKRRLRSSQVRRRIAR